MDAKGISLHLGLNSVDPKHYAGWSGDLVACEADANDMAELAAANKFQSTTILTKDATRDAARKAIRSAADALTSGDIFLLTYSGHGGQLPDKNGDEDDFKDETWCLFDGEIVDDELFSLYTNFKKGVRVFVLSDSCHSGSATRAARERAEAAASSARRRSGGADAGKPPLVRAIPDAIAMATYQQNRAEYNTYLKNVPSQSASAQALSAPVRLISGCQDDQVSLDGTFNGLFTGTLLGVWNDGAFRGDYAGFHGAIVAKMPDTQEPRHSVIGPANPAFDAQKPFTI